MKKLKALAIIGFSILCGIYGFLLGTTQAPIETKAYEVREVIPEGYVKIEDCIPLEDIAYWFIDSNDYICFELKDVGNQLDNPKNKSYKEIVNNLEDITDEIHNNYVDMR